MGLKRDKLDRYRTMATAVLTQQADVPFWVTLTPRERATMKPTEKQHFFQRNADGRRGLRDFVRSLCK